jgi:hypothetical protein
VLQNHKAAACRLGKANTLSINESDIFSISRWRVGVYF